MKRLLKIFLPAICMLALIWLLRDGKDILVGIYLIFPLIFVAIGLFCCSLIKELVFSTLLTGAAFLIPFNRWFHMGSGVGELCIYCVLCCVAYLLKRIVLRKQKQ